MSYIIKMALDIKARFNPPAHMSSPITVPLELLQKPLGFPVLNAKILCLKCARSFLMLRPAKYFPLIVLKRSIKFL